MFVIRPGNIIPIMLALPPTSLQPAKQYFLRLANAGKHYSAVLTRFGLVEDKNGDGVKYSKVVLTKVADLTPEQAQVFRTMSDTMRPWLERVKATVDDYATTVSNENASATEAPANGIPI